MSSGSIAVSASLLLLAILFIARGWYGDRARGRARCPKCWYSLDSGSSKCAECGRAFESELEKYKTRRRWRLVIAGAAFAVAGALSPTLMVGLTRGWPAAAPTVVLVQSMGHLDPNDKFAQELLERCKASSSWSESKRRSVITAACAVLRENRESASTSRSGFALRVLRYVKNSDEVGYPTMVSFVDHPDAETRMKLIEAVVSCGLNDDHSNSILIPLLSDQDNKVRLLAVRAYFFLPFTERSADVMQRISTSDSDPFIREISTIVLREFRVNKLKGMGPP